MLGEGNVGTSTTLKQQIVLLRSKWIFFDPVERPT
jgi:hypothetical protein